MNKNILFGIWCLIITLYSCNANDINVENNEEIDEVNVKIQSFLYEDKVSRATINSDFQPIWTENDTIGIFPNIGGQVEFPITEGYGQSYAKFNGGGWALKANYTYHAYYPFNFYNRNSKAVPFSYLGQEQDGNNPKGHIGKYLFLAAAPTESKEGKLDFTLDHMGSIWEIELTLPEATSYTSMFVYSDTKIFPIKKTFNLPTYNSETKTIEEDIKDKDKSDRITLKLKNITTTKKNEKVTCYIILPSIKESGHKLRVAVYDKDGHLYTAQLYKSDNKTEAITPINLNSAPYRIASPVLNEGLNAGLKDWEIGGSYEGNV